MTQPPGRTNDQQLVHLQQLIADLDSVRVQFEQLAASVYLALAPIVIDIERADTASRSDKHLTPVVQGAGH